MKEGRMKISRILATKGTGTITIHPDKTIRDAIFLLEENNIGALPVLDTADRLVGILTERDIIRTLVEDEAVFGKTVATLMTREVITGVVQEDLDSVAITMTENHFRHLPILEGNKLVGIISIGDVVKAQRDEFRGLVDTLQTLINKDDA
jgi:CBS domain-containing protein